MRSNPLIMTVMGNPGRQYRPNPFVLVDSGSLKIIRNWKGSMMDRKPWQWAQEAARRLDRDVYVVAHPYVPAGFKAGVEVSPLFFAGGPFQVVSSDGRSRQGDLTDIRQSNPGFAASMAGSLAGGLLASALSNPGKAYKPFSWRVLEACVNERVARDYVSRYSRETLAQALQGNDRNGAWWPDELAEQETGAPTTLENAIEGMVQIWHDLRPYSPNPRRPNEPDPVAARELELYVSNDSQLYHSQFIPIVKNLMKRRANGTYNHEKAAKLFLYLADAGAKKYYKEFSTPGGSFRFDLATRWATAKSLRDSFETEAELGNYDRMAFGVSNNPCRNPLTSRESADVLRAARRELAYGQSFRPGFTRSESAGQAMGRAKVVRKYGTRRAGRAAGRIELRAQRVAGTPFSNPGPKHLRGQRKVTMPIERFAKIVKAQKDPALWRDFVAKCKGYHKWSHGTWPTKVTVEAIKKPGMRGIWIAYGMGKEPEKTYIMPKGTKRKGAWKHPWTKMPSLMGDPEAGFILTKLVKGNKMTDFLHGN